MKILGISALYHDSAAALVCDGIIVAAAQEERFTRIKHDAAFPMQAINYCLQAGNTRIQDIDYIVFYEKPFIKFERLLETYLAFAPRGFKSFATAIPLWIKEKLFQKKLLIDKLKTLDPKGQYKNKILFAEHHQSHAASAYYPSPFNEAIVLTMDGVGEWATTSVAIGRDNKLEIVKEIHFPHSLGLLYSAFTYYTGFKVNSGEYKLMGLAPYGQPKYKDLILQKLIDLKEDGSFRLNMDYFDFCTGFTMTNKNFNQLFGGPPRHEDEPITQKHMDLAASVQAALEEAVLKLAQNLRSEYNIANLCLAGGVALNCVANGKIMHAQIFDNIWIQPAAGDAGGALGAALAAYYDHLQSPRQIANVDNLDSMQGSYLGPIFSEAEIEQRLQAVGAKFAKFSQVEMLQTTAQHLANNLVVGWVQGRMEFGPRALGARSILGNPCSEQMQKNLNLKIKFRESFRPFAPAVLAEDVQEWFNLNTVSPYMLLVTDVAERTKISMQSANQDLFGIDLLNVARSSIPAVTHVDYSARVQTVHATTNPLFHDLIKNFKSLTGCPVVINTSFNIRGEPIVCTPEDAFRCFMGTEMDVLVVGNCIMRKHEQDPELMIDYRNSFKLD